MNVYDFDETIYDGESDLDFFFYYMKKTPWLVKYIPKVVYVLIRYKLGRLTVEELYEGYSAIAESYLSGIKDLQADSVDFWNRHEHKIKPFYASLHRDDDVIITASPEFTTKIICDRLGIKHCIGTQVDMNTCKITSICMGKNKIPAFFNAFPDAEIDNFYTDSETADAPLIEAAKHAFIVKGNKITRIK